jgi:NTE family protein
MAHAPTTALVISGGGSKGAFAVGVIDSLYTRFRATGWFDIVGGTSVGALIAPFASLMKAPEPIAAEALETLRGIATSLSTSDILEHRTALELLRRRDALNEAHPLYSLLHRLLRPEWFDWLQSPAAPRTYAVHVNYRTGRKVVATPRDPGMDLDRFILSLMASASVPVYMEATVIDGDLCYDGGLREILPCAEAIDYGAELIVPIQLDPPSLRPAPAAPRRLDEVLTRTIEIFLDELRFDDLERAKFFAAAGRLRESLRAAFADDPRGRKLVEQALGMATDGSPFGDANRLSAVIEGLQPDETLTGTALEFEPTLMREWMRMGARKALEVISSSPFLALEPAAQTLITAS